MAASMSARLRSAFGGVHPRQRGAHGGAQQVVQAGIGIVERQARAGAGHQQHLGPGAARQADRQRERGVGRLLVRAAGDLANALAQAVHAQRGVRRRQGGHRPGGGIVRRQPVRRQRSPGLHAGVAGEAVVAAGGVEFVEQHERQVELELRQGLDQLAAQAGAAVGAAQLRGQVAQRARTPFAQHGRRGFRHRVEQAADIPALLADRAERKGEEGLFQVAVPGQEHALVFQERGPPLARRLERRAERGPGRGPALGVIHAERGRVLFAAQDAVAVVVDLDVLRSPDDIDGEVGRQAQADGRAQALRPGGNRAQRRVGPVAAEDLRGHLAAAGQEGLFG
jgi:hypothetical protein